MNRGLSSHSSYPYIYRPDERMEGGGVSIPKILKNLNKLSKTEMDINAETISNLFVFLTSISNFYN
jgi:hypothetical protein